MKGRRQNEKRYPPHQDHFPKTPPGPAGNLIDPCHFERPGPPGANDPFAGVIPYAVTARGLPHGLRVAFHLAYPARRQNAGDEADIQPPTLRGGITQPDERPCGGAPTTRDEAIRPLPLVLWAKGQ